jgi:hypothetical protein
MSEADYSVSSLFIAAEIEMLYRVIEEDLSLGETSLHDSIYQRVAKAFNAVTICLRIPIESIPPSTRNRIFIALIKLNKETSNNAGQNDTVWSLFLFIRRAMLRLVPYIGLSAFEDLCVVPELSDMYVMQQWLKVPETERLVIEVGEHVLRYDLQ